MAEYIDRETLCRQLSLLAERYNALGNVRVAQDYNWAVTVLDGAQAEDVAPVVHGRWEFLGPNRLIKECLCGTCSVCKVRSKYIVNPALCPNCGAKMDGGDPDGR